MNFNIEYFPKNKKENVLKLSNEQLNIRNSKLLQTSNGKKYAYKESYLKKHGRRNYEDKEQRCNKCNFVQPIEEFYVRKETQKRRKVCRDCQMKARGVVEIGRQRFADIILRKGFRRCSVCKIIKPLNLFSHKKKGYGGFSSNCYQCSYTMHLAFQKKGYEEINDWYVREYGKRNGITKFNKKIINKLREEIIESRKPKYFLDNKEFVTGRDFAKYIKNRYGNPITMTEKRISDGKTEIECKLSETEMRVLYSGTNKGKVKVTDTVTGRVFMFKNGRDKRLKKMFSWSTVDRVIKMGGLTKVRYNSKYHNPCKIERINK